MIKKYYHNPIDMIALGRTLERKKGRIEALRKEALSCSFFGKRKCCPICESRDIREYLKIFNFDYYICDNCDHLFYVQILSNDEIKKLYSESDYLCRYIDDKFYKQRLTNIAIPRVKFIREILYDNDESRINNTKWIDIGCGGCDILLATKMAGFSVEGIDSSLKAQEISKIYGINVYNEFITYENIDKFINHHDIVSAFNFIEHIENPVAMIQSFSKSIKSSAYVIIQVPRHPCYQLFCAMNLPELTSVNLIPPHHIHIFSDKSAEIMFNKCGMEIKSIYYFGRDFFEILNTLLFFSNRELSSFPAEITNSINHIQRAIDECELSDCMLIIAQKIQDF